MGYNRRSSDPKPCWHRSQVRRTLGRWLTALLVWYVRLGQPPWHPDSDVGSPAVADPVPLATRIRATQREADRSLSALDLAVRRYQDRAIKQAQDRETLRSMWPPTPEQQAIRDRAYLAAKRDFGTTPYQMSIAERPEVSCLGN